VPEFKLQHQRKKKHLFGEKKHLINEVVSFVNYKKAAGG
jgi:hypothetical protein